MDNISKQLPQPTLSFSTGIRVYLNVLFVLHLNKLFISTLVFPPGLKKRGGVFFFTISLECFQFADISLAFLVLY